MLVVWYNYTMQLSMFWWHKKKKHTDIIHVHVRTVHTRIVCFKYMNWWFSISRIGETSHQWIADWTFIFIKRAEKVNNNYIKKNGKWEVRNTVCVCVYILLYLKSTFSEYNVALSFKTWIKKNWLKIYDMNWYQLSIVYQFPVQQQDKRNPFWPDSGTYNSSYWKRQRKRLFLRVEVSIRRKNCRITSSERMQC